MDISLSEVTNETPGGVCLVRGCAAGCAPLDQPTGPGTRWDCSRTEFDPGRR